MPILTYGMECFELFSEQRRKMRVAFNTVIRRIFKLSKYTSVHDVIVFMGSKPSDIILDERRFFIVAVLYAECLWYNKEMWACIVLLKRCIAYCK